MCQEQYLALDLQQLVLIFIQKILHGIKFRLKIFSCLLKELIFRIGNEMWVASRELQHVMKAFLIVINLRLIILDFLQNGLFMQMAQIVGVRNETSIFGTLSFALLRLASNAIFLSAAFTPFAKICTFGTLLALFSVTVIGFYAIYRLWIRNSWWEWSGSCTLSIIVFRNHRGLSIHMAWIIGSSKYTMLEDKGGTLRTASRSKCRKPWTGAYDGNR